MLLDVYSYSPFGSDVASLVTTGTSPPNATVSLLIEKFGISCALFSIVNPKLFVIVPL